MIVSFSKIIFLFLILSAAPVLSFGQTRNLSDYFAFAKDSNPQLKENANEQKVSDLQNDLTFSQFKYPQIFFTADYLFAPYLFNNGQFLSVTPTPDQSAYGYDPATTNGGLYSAQLNFSLPLFSGFLTDPIIKQNLNQKKSLTLSNEQLLHDLNKDVTAQYLTVYAAQQQFVFLDHILSLLADRKKIVAALVQRGILQQTDYLQLQIEFNSRKYDRQIQKQQLIEALSQLNNLCGISDTSIYELKKPDLFLTPLQSEFKSKIKFQADSLNLVIQQEIFETKYKPQLSVFGNTGLNATETSNLSHNLGFSAGLHLNIPLYDGNQKSITEQQNNLQIDNLTRNYHVQQKVQFNSLLSTKSQIKQLSESLILLDEQLNDQENLLSLLKDKIANGQVSVTDYNISLQNYIQTNQNKLQTQLTYWQMINQFNYLNW